LRFPDPRTVGAVRRLMDLALDEDVGPGDITTECLVPPEQRARAVLVAKEPFVAAGLPLVREVFLRLDPAIVFNGFCSDGDRADAGDRLAVVEGKLGALLVGERTALNFLQRLSGIATHVRHYVEMLGNATLRLTDTRKTTPGWRALEKYAVRVGGARNHRMGLYDGVLIKDNHIACCGGIGRAVERIRQSVPHTLRVEVEVENLDQVREALEAGADVIMLDNMTDDQVREAVATIAARALVEVSGRVDARRLAALAGLGVDIVSVGALTHSAPSVDIGMDMEPLS